MFLQVQYIGKLFERLEIYRLTNLLLILKIFPEVDNSV